MTSDADVELRAGRLTLSLSPLIGGSIREFLWEDWLGILRRCNSSSQKVLDHACFPLVPYVNRIRGGEFTFRGRTVRLRPNMAGDPNPLHGQGWLNPWAVESASERTAMLTYAHKAAEWPWAYEARQEFSLDEAGLSARLTCRNADAQPMPCGLGFHPYFPCGPETLLDTSVACAWTIDAHVLPVDKVPAEGRYDLSNRQVCGQDLDNGFGDWGGSAAMTDPSWPYGLRLSSPNARFFQLYSPPGGGIFVAEPVTHANAALNEPEERWPELGLRVLAPGEEMQLDMRIDVRAG
jgi:aldose 1-epimerase